VLCAIDFSPASLRALEYAMSCVREDHGRLTLLHVIDALEAEPLADPPGRGLEYREQLFARARRRLEALLPVGVHRWCRPAIAVREGRPSGAILRVARETGAHTIALGITGRGTVDLALFGSTANRVIRGAECPVLTLRWH
jgi:nucleotide-binding universal stress UspA family protein